MAGGMTRFQRSASPRSTMKVSATTEVTSRTIMKSECIAKTPRRCMAFDAALVHSETRGQGGRWWCVCGSLVEERELHIPIIHPYTLPHVRGPLGERRRIEN